jgi:hypothetical protein
MEIANTPARKGRAALAGNTREAIEVEDHRHDCKPVINGKRAGCIHGNMHGMHISTSPSIHDKPDSIGPPAVWRRTSLFGF